jgi:hypothetical protein
LHKHPPHIIFIKQVASVVGADYNVPRFNYGVTAIVGLNGIIEDNLMKLPVLVYHSYAAACSNPYPVLCVA